MRTQKFVAPPTHTDLSRSSGALRWVLLGIAGVALAVQVEGAAFGFGGQTLADANGLLISISMCAAALAGLIGAASAKVHRTPRLVISAGICIYALGAAYLFTAEEALASFPTTSDFLRLSLYPLILIGAFLVIRSEAPGRQLRALLEGAIVALTVVALCYGILLEGILSQARISDNLVSGQLSYPVLDFLAFIILLAFGLGNRNAAHVNYLLMGLGVTVLLVTDATNLDQLAQGAYAPGTLLGSGWPAATLLVALSLQFQRPIIRPRALTGWGYYALMSLSLLLSVALFGIEMGTDRDVIIIALTALVPVLVLVQLLWSIAANQRLTEDNAKIVAAAGAGIVRLDTDSRIVSVNPVAARMLGWGQEDLIGRNAHATMHHKRENGTPYPQSQCPTSHAIQSGEIQRITDEVFWRKDGTSFPVDYISSPLREVGRITGGVLVFDDVTRQRGLESRLRHQADHDALTGLFNRRHFDEEASEQVRQTIRHRRPGALAIIDLDAFKFVNDSLGHAAGDQVLCKIASILRQRIRDTDVIARLGGDEFALLLREIEPDEAVALTRRILAEVKRDTAPTLTASAGIAIFDGAQKLTGDDLLISADLALYEAKQQGGDQAVRFSGSKGQALTWVERIREGIEEDRFVVYTQPIVDLKSGVVAREELLVRMRNELGDIIPPASFLPTAERFNLIGQIDRLMVDKGLRLAEEGRPVAINLSACSLSDPEIIGRVGAAVADGLDPGLVSFEITETSAATNMAAAVEFAGKLERLGCELALDDFGTGFGSFSYLRRLPVQVIKIDVEFVRDLPHNLSDYHLVRVLVSLAGSLGQKTIAEGVEDGACLELLRRLGVDYAQGYFIGRPREVESGNSRQVEPEGQAALAVPLHA